MKGQLCLPGLEDIPPGGGRLVKSFTKAYPRVVGTFSSYFPGRGREVLLDTHVRIGPGPESWGWPPTGVARRIIWERRGRWPDRWVEERVLRMPMPAYAVSGDWPGEWVLVDIRRAFESVLLRWGVRQVSPLRYFSATPAWTVPAPYWFGPGEKWVLRVLPSVARGGSRVLELAEGRFVRVPTQPLDPRPWGTVAAVLWGVAWRAWELGGIYWNTDGGLVPAASLDEFGDWLGEVGLTFHIRARGEADVRGVGAYRVGSMESGHYARIKRPTPHFPDLELGPWALRVVERACAGGGNVV